MISNHLNLVEQHRPDAESIAERIAQHLAAGGRIELPKPAPIKFTSTSEWKGRPSFLRLAVGDETTARVSPFANLPITSSEWSSARRQE